jgi:polyhydroxyalkanoate synthesis regulator phasin
MADIENQAIHILRELRAAIKALDDEVDRSISALGEKVDHGFADARSRMNNLRQAINGESVLGRYAASEVEERLEWLEERVSRLEKAT